MDAEPRTWRANSRLDSRFWLVRVSVFNLGIAEGPTVQPNWSTDSRQSLWKFQWHWFSEIKKHLKSQGIPNSQKILKKKNKAGGLILSNLKWKVKEKSLSRARLFATPWIVACTRLLRPWDFQGKSTGVGCHFLLQGISPTQGSNPGLSHCRQTLHRLSRQGSPNFKTRYKAVIIQSVWRMPPRLGLAASTARGVRSVPGWGTEIRQVTQHDRKKGQRTWIDASPKRTCKCNKRMKIRSTSSATHKAGWLHSHFHQPLVAVEVLAAQSCLTLCDRTDYNPPGFSVHGVL